MRKKRHVRFFAVGVFIIWLIILAVTLLLSSCAPTPTATYVPPTRKPTTIPPTATAKPTLFARPHLCIPNQEPVEADVVRIVDGDTIEVAVVGAVEKVRLIGIDTPERGEAGFEEASAATSNMVSGKTVLLWQDVSDRDRYDRLLAYVTVGKVFVNYELVARGFAQSYRYPPDTSCADVFDKIDRTRIAPTATKRPAIIIVPPTQPPAQTNNCHPSYEGACLLIGAGDYDCAGGGGNGPNYTGKVRVVGYDEFRLDRDGDGWGCE
jgi:endonuclease YncB( thermonuclease family)